MEKVKTASANPADSEAVEAAEAAVDEHQQIQKLLSSVSWHQRLEEARAKRQKVLSENAETGLGSLDDELKPSGSGAKRPWESASAGMSNVITALRLTQNHLVNPDAAKQASGSEPSPKRKPADDAAPEAAPSPPSSASTADRSAPEAETSPTPLPLQTNQIAPQKARSHAAPPVGRAVRSLEHSGEFPLPVAPTTGPTRWGRVAFVIAAFAFGLGLGLGVAELVSLSGDKVAKVVGDEVQIAVELASADPAPRAELPLVPETTTAQINAAQGNLGLVPGVSDAATAPVLPAEPDDTTAAPTMPQLEKVAPVSTETAAPVLNAGVPLADQLPSATESAASIPLVGPVPAENPAPLPEMMASAPASVHNPAGPVFVASPHLLGAEAMAAPELPLSHLETVSAPLALPEPVITEPALAEPVVADPVISEPVVLEPANPAQKILAVHDIRVFVPTDPQVADFAAVSAKLAAAGYQVQPADRVNFTVSADHVRYYHATDQAIAEAVAEKIGGPARDFTNSENSPALGTIEVWLAGKGVSVAKPAAKKVAKNGAKTTAGTVAAAAAKPPAGPTEAEQAQALRAWLLYQLKTGKSY